MIAYYSFTVTTADGLVAQMWRAAESREEAARTIIGDIQAATDDWVSKLEYNGTSLDPYKEPFRKTPDD